MNTIASDADPAEKFWQFSLAFYARPGVAEALLALQDEAGLDVNLILFGCWLGLSGRGRADRALIDRARTAAEPVRAQVIVPLRRLRRALAPAGEADLERLRERIKAIELEAEHAAQTLLAAFAPAAALREPGQCLADAAANLALILGRGHAAGAAPALLRRELRALVAAR
jgi:uncharacterized protein (TIGR02444 family)